MSFEEVLAPAVGYAEEGFGITERIRNDWASDDIYTYNADSRFVHVPLERLLSKEYAATLTKLINPHRAPRRAVFSCSGQR